MDKIGLDLKVLEIEARVEKKQNGKAKDLMDVGKLI